MSKRRTREIKRLILQLLHNEGDLTFAQLERKVNTNFVTVRSNCEELAAFGMVTITKKERHPATGRPYFIVGITKRGKTIVEGYYA